MDNHLCLIFDPIPFKGGSKIATNDALAESNPNQRFVVVTIEPKFWQQSRLQQSHNIQIIKLWLLPWLNKFHTGKGYWLNQLWIALSLMFIVFRIKTTTGSMVQTVIGASGPGIDMPLYIVKRLLHWKVIQFVHGNSASSRSIGYCFSIAEHVFYLPTTRNSILSALLCYLSPSMEQTCATTLAEKTVLSSRFHTFINGIPESRWPTRCHAPEPRLFWAASLLKWKGLDLLVEALRMSESQIQLASTLCYIRPKDIDLPISMAPVEAPNTAWFEDPNNLDEIRAQSSIFVSTSVNEPFGLSILEALAAGLCVVIPQDGAFWDQELIHGVNCIKYKAGDSTSLSNALVTLTHDTHLIALCQQSGLKVAHKFHACHQYREFTETLSTPRQTALKRLKDSLG